MTRIYSNHIVHLIATYRTPLILPGADRGDFDQKAGQLSAARHPYNIIPSSSSWTECSNDETRCREMQTETRIFCNGPNEGQLVRAHEYDGVVTSKVDFYWLEQEWRV